MPLEELLIVPFIPYLQTSDKLPPCAPTPERANYREQFFLISVKYSALVATTLFWAFFHDLEV
jgi:hypothetical protein